MTFSTDTTFAVYAVFHFCDFREYSEYSTEVLVGDGFTKTMIDTLALDVMFSDVISSHEWNENDSINQFSHFEFIPSGLPSPEEERELEMLDMEAEWDEAFGIPEDELDDHYEKMAEYYGY